VCNEGASLTGPGTDYCKRLRFKNFDSAPEAMVSSDKFMIGIVKNVNVKTL
jgi:hypothetical protein